MVYVPIDGRPFTLSMGLRTLNIVDWIEIDSHFDAELMQKRNLLQQVHDQVFVSLPEGMQGSLETLTLLKEFLPSRFPDKFPLNIEVDDNLHPLEAASLLVQEDLVVMSPIDDQWILTAACVCFPSRWDLTQKLGQNLFDIHGPVPHYEERIGQATHTMFGKFTPERPVWRINWTVLDSPELHQPSGTTRATAGMTFGDDPRPFDQRTFFRTERQTMRVLPSSDVLFTIRSYVNSLAEIATMRPEFRQQLADTLNSASADTRAYKGWAPMWTDLMAWAIDSQ